MRLHLVGIFHTLHKASYSHCAFTGKALRFPKMMRPFGYEVIEYSNEGSESDADEKVVILSHNEYESLYGRRGHTDFYGNDATIGSDGHRLFEAKLIMEMRKRIQPGDIVCHPFGHAHQKLLEEFPNNRHVETGIGYPTLMPGSFRIFESYAWMHYHQGKEGRSGRNYEWVVPNYYDLEDWDVSEKPGDYLAFLGRIDSCKGLDTIKALADYTDIPIVLHGQGDASKWEHPMIEYRGPISGKSRSDFLKGARAILAPTNFVEPFCGMAVEAMLCGTPVMSVDYGAMTETVIDGMTGFRCHTLQDWVDAIDGCEKLDRLSIANYARNRFSLEACGAKYDKIFRQIADLDRRGWYEVNRINYYEIEREEKPFADRLAKWIADELKPERAIDIGCGPGIFVDSMRECGINAVGYDTDERVIGIANLSQCDALDLDETAPFVLCLEVAEHVEPELGESFAHAVAKCVDSGGYLIWSAAHPGQGGVGHINCQPKDYWWNILASCGLVRQIDLETQLMNYIVDGYHMGWFRNNGMVFRAP